MSKKTTTDKLQELFDLHKSGALTKEEYESLKSEIIGKEQIFEGSSKNQKIVEEDKPDLPKEKELEEKQSKKIEPEVNRPAAFENKESEDKSQEKKNTITDTSKKEKKGRKIWLLPVIVGLCIIAFVIFKFTLFSTKSDVTDLQEQIVEDIDGNVYHTVKIGSQVWMVENLKTTKYNDGTPIPLVTANSAWRALTTPAYCWYNNDETTNKNTFGALYNWYAVNTNKLCPIGWHVPTAADWKILTTYLTNYGYGYQDSGDDISKSLASTLGWDSSSNTGAVGNDLLSNNRSGFTAFASGIRFSNGEFRHSGQNSKWWSSTETSTSAAQIRFISWDDGIVDSYSNRKENGFSVRCVKDIGVPEKTLHETSTESKHEKATVVWDEATARKSIIDELKNPDGWEYESQIVRLMGHDEVTFQKIDLGKSHKMIGFASSNFFEVNQCPPICNDVFSVFVFEYDDGWELTQKAKGITSSSSNFAEIRCVQVSPDNYGILVTESKGNSRSSFWKTITLHTFLNNQLKPILNLSHEETRIPYSVEIKKQARNGYYFLIVEEKEEPKDSDPIITNTFYKFNGSEYEKYNGSFTDPSLTSLDRMGLFENMEAKEKGVCPTCNGTGVQTCNLCGGSGVNNLGMTCSCVTQYENQKLLGQTPDHPPKRWICLRCGGTGTY